MWSPTHIQVTVLRAKGLLTKGKNGTNNCFVTIALGKEKYQTSVKEKSPQDVEWREECELTIPDRGNRAELVLTCLHHNNLGLDEFLGQVTLPLNEMDTYDHPRSKWFKLESKPGKEKKKERGELEVRVSFTVKLGSLNDLSKKEKHKSSIGQIAQSVGGSLLSLGALDKKKSIKKFAKSLGSKMHISGRSNKKGKDIDSDSFTGSFASIGTPSSVGGGSSGHRRFGGQSVGDADPGVISEDEDEFVFDNLSHKSSGSSLNIRTGVHNNNNILNNKNNITASPVSSIRGEIAMRSKTLGPIKSSLSRGNNNNNSEKLDEWEAKLYSKQLDIGSTDSLKRRSWETERIPLPLHTQEEPKESVSDITQKILETESSPTKSTEKQSSIQLKNNNESDINSNSTKSPIIEETSHLNEIKSNKNEKGDEKKESPFKKSGNYISTPPNPPEKLPKALPRSNTTECLISNSSPEKNEKSSEKKRFGGKLKYFRRDKTDIQDDLHHKQFGERIIIGHEMLSNESDMQISKELLKKYEGKSREEVILLANNFEHEVIIQRQRVKELEDYLDDLLLRVMETHPKILQNPYNRTTSTKSG